MTFLLVLQILCSMTPQEPPSTLAEARWSVVTVLPGDGWSDLADHFLVTQQELHSWNPSVDPDLPTGTRLRVLSKVPAEELFRQRIRISSPTSWEALSQEYALPLPTLLAINGQTRAGPIRSGKRVVVYVSKEKWRCTSLDGAVQLQSSDDVLVKHPEWAWGRPVSIHGIEQAARDLARAFPGTKIVVGDLSTKDGGTFPPHKTHKCGLDVDIGLCVRDEPFTVKFRDLKTSKLDARRTWRMVRAFLENPAVTRVILDWRLQRELYEEAVYELTHPDLLDLWFQYPHGKHDKTGIIRHYKGHRNHIHVRFAEPDEPVFCGP